MNKPILLILDLDETLVHATAQPLAQPADFQVFGYHLYKRPGLDEFLRQVAPHFQLVVWPSASDDYVQAVVEHIFPAEVPLALVWGRSRCTPFTWPQLEDDCYWPGSYQYAKRLKKVRRRGYDLRRVLIVDDTPAKVLQHYGNAIYPQPFEGQPGDQELQQLAPYLLSLTTAVNVRAIEKRCWRTAHHPAH